MRILSIDIGGTTVQMGIFTRNGDISDYKKIPAKSYYGGPDMIMRIIESIKLCYNNFDAIGISTAGQVNHKEGSIMYANENIPKYTGIPLRDIFESTFSVPVKVENDVNAAAIGEHYYGAAIRHNSFLCLTYGTGIGGALFLNGKIYKGRDGFAGEFGHMRLYPNGELCNCGGKGCYEQYASTNALVNEAQKISRKYLNGEMIFKHIEEDQQLFKVFQTWVNHISLGLVNLIHIFNPPLIVLGGGVMEQKYIVKMVKEQTGKLIMDSFSNLEIVGASLGNQAGLLGAGSLHLDP